MARVLCVPGSHGLWKEYVGAASSALVRSSGRRPSWGGRFCWSPIYGTLCNTRLGLFFAPKQVALRRKWCLRTSREIAERGWRSGIAGVLCVTGHMDFGRSMLVRRLRCSYGVPDADFLRRLLLLEPNIRNSLQYAFRSFFARTDALAENGV